jgi:hypothetical protein
MVLGARPVLRPQGCGKFQTEALPKIGFAAFVVAEHGNYQRSKELVFGEKAGRSGRI